MSSQGSWGAIGIAAVGMIGTVTAGAIGYQSGSKAVDKDYVQMAIGNLSNKQTSPELRQWSAEILDRLAPVPLSKELKTELRSGPFVQFISPHITIPREISKPCPDLIGRDKEKTFKQRDIETHNKIFEEFVLEYEICRAKHESFVKWANETQRLLDEANRTEKLK